jgi:hypothetical protein
MKSKNNKKKQGNPLATTPNDRLEQRKINTSTQQLPIEKPIHGG